MPFHPVPTSPWVFHRKCRRDCGYHRWPSCWGTPTEYTLAGRCEASGYPPHYLWSSEMSGLCSSPTLTETTHLVSLSVSVEIGVSMAPQAPEAATTQPACYIRGSPQHTEVVTSSNLDCPIFPFQFLLFFRGSWTYLPTLRPFSLSSGQSPCDTNK